MRAVVQRVSHSSVEVEGQAVTEMGAGLVALVGITHSDDEAAAHKLAGKIAHLRVLADDAGAMNRSVLDSGGSVLVVSQFTLYGDTSRGRRPSWLAAAPPQHAAPLVDAVAQGLERLGVHVGRGVFGASMQLGLINDGPVTILLEV